ncbi:TetR/AcrR family transcriptional regulator [Actinomadura sp. ATCC 31491]|uniref:TetR/AcrR family transcriptional regulator n=1 Tax=Actinomadura luzonensis TaxID=2805427 RepID=A0ABT0FU74_9ACTN|nr:TetR/AcrR family transcriptional regulator [Actinomadura luzonensis]MCK2215857.1 TetR/AcrR family transcriptional regulator [Actinomadura luzonensis]
MPGSRRPNRGPSAAAANRAALIAAAREVFATEGYGAPLSSVARAAGVGQGSLYRHFPDRVALAMAVFEEGVTALEALAAEPGSTLDDLLALMTDQAVSSTGLIELVSRATREPDQRVLGLRERVTGLLAGVLADPRRAPRLRPGVTADDLMLVFGMIAGALAHIPAAERRATAERAWSLLRRGVEK